MANCRVKICGITRCEDALVASEHGADAIGLVFYEPSPRHLSDLGLAREIAQSVGPFVNVVALTVNASKSYLDDIIREVPVSLLQFHGDETPVECERFELPYIKAIRMRPGIDVQQKANDYRASVGLLLDTYVKGVPGGTGESFNWDLMPANIAKPLVLAGGLSPDNVGRAVIQAAPYAVDVSGGVESSPGVKSHTKIHRFVQEVRSRR